VGHALPVEGLTIPPHDPAAERLVLCGLLREFGLAGGEVRRVGLRGDDLYLDLHRRVWGAVAGLAHAGRPVSPWEVWRELGRAGEWGEFPRAGVLNPAFSCARWLLALLDDDPTGVWAMGAAVRVRELAERRRRMHELRRQLRELEAGAPLESVAV
jgi:replicative DNA helicase